MARVKILDNERVLRCCSGDDIFVFVQPDGLEELQHDFDDRGICTRRSDIAVFLNQKLLDKKKVSPLAIQNFVDAFRKKTSSDYLKNQPDNVLMEVVRSRYIQSPADVYRYNQIIEQDFVKFEDDVRSAIEEHKAKQQSEQIEQQTEQQTE